MDACFLYRLYIFPLTCNVFITISSHPLNGSIFQVPSLVLLFVEGQKGESLKHEAIFPVHIIYGQNNDPPMMACFHLLYMPGVIFMGQEILCRFY